MTERLDSYWRAARLYPAVVIVLPPAVFSVSLFGFDASLGDAIKSAGLAGVGVLAVLYAASVLARSRGKLVERRLLLLWGCLPSTRLLRHSDSTLPNRTKERYRQYLARNVGKLPTATSETRDPEKADAQYADAVLWLKEQRRGPRYALLLKENAEYGFRRNLRGLRSPGLFLAAGTLFCWVAVASDGFSVSIRDLITGATAGQIIAVVPAVLVGGYLWLIVRDEWVKEAADQYAITLLATCDTAERVSEIETGER